MNNKSIRVIRADLSGFSIGCLARMNGFDAYIFGHHTLPGNVSAACKREERAVYNTVCLRNKEDNEGKPLAEGQ